MPEAMKTADEWYRAFRIMPSLAAHQRRVAAVACAVIDAGGSGTPAGEDLRRNRREIVSACLLHDMGNILKFDLSYFPEFLEPEGSAYWESVKAEFSARYGDDEHGATLAIAREIGVSERTFGYIDAVGFRMAAGTLAGRDPGKMLCCYADMRVAPLGIVSLGERFDEGTKRYAGRSRRDADPEYAERQVSAIREMESLIFVDASISPSDITDASCEKYFYSLGSFAIA